MNLLLANNAIKSRPLEGKAQDHQSQQGEYVKGDIYTNTVENTFSLLKRGIMGS